MCGIAGFIDFNKKSDKQTLQKMTDILHHRGPDDSGYSFYETEFANIGLGHRRLSILDLTAHGHQPMIFQDIEIVYNGEVYNFPEIARGLEDCGYSFKSQTDTEVILKAYHKWGVMAVHKFNGMFAIAIYDKKAQKMIFIRDRAGVKPLYWYFDNNLFLFASELKSFYQHSSFEKEIDEESLRLYLQHGYIPQPYSIFKNSHKLRAGNYLEIDLKDKKISEYEYWNIEEFFKKDKINLSINEAITQTEEILKSAFRYRMVSDVAVGVFLSGGYDSSAVTAILQANSTKKIKTFTIGFKEEKYNEAIYAKQVANYLGTEHYEHYLTQKDALQILPSLPVIYDEPFADSSAIPTIMVSRFAKQSVTVSLSADGADELFSGYPSYKKTYDLYNKFNKVKSLRRLNSIGAKIDPYYLSKYLNIYNFEGKYYKFFEMLSNSNHPLNFYNTNTKYFYDEEIRLLLNADINKKDKGIMVAINDNDISNIKDKMLAYSFNTYLNDDILTKVDRATMSVSLEGREPFLDYRLVEFVSQLPSEYKQNGNETKYILKQIVHKYIPEDIMDRKKMGFSIPVFEWFRDELKKYFEVYLNEKAVRESGIFEYGYIKKLKNSYFKGKGNPHKLWLILVFQMWWKIWMG